MSIMIIWRRKQSRTEFVKHDMHPIPKLTFHTFTQLITNLERSTTFFTTVLYCDCLIMHRCSRVMTVFKARQEMHLGWDFCLEMLGRLKNTQKSLILINQSWTVFSTDDLWNLFLIFSTSCSDPIYFVRLAWP